MKHDQRIQIAVSIVSPLTRMGISISSRCADRASINLPGAFALLSALSGTRYLFEPRFESPAWYIQWYLYMKKRQKGIVPHSNLRFEYAEVAFAEHPLVGPATLGYSADTESSGVRFSLSTATSSRCSPGKCPTRGKSQRRIPPPSPKGSPPCCWGFNCGLMAKSPRFHMTLGIANTRNKRYTFSRRLIVPVLPFGMDRSSFSSYLMDLSFSFFSDPNHTRRSAWRVLITSAVAIL